MKFGQFSVEDANGLVLAHSLRLPEATIVKGQVLQEGDLCRLREAGIRHVTGLRVSVDDVGENRAAEMLVQSIAAAHVD